MLRGKRFLPRKQFQKGQVCLEVCHEKGQLCLEVCHKKGQMCLEVNHEKGQSIMSGSVS